MRVAVLGATGLVGQKFIALLEREAFWKVTQVVASDEKVSKSYAEGCLWKEPLMPMPSSVRELFIESIEHIESDIVVSFLPSQIALELETYCLTRGKMVFSNTDAYRRHPQVPILIPEVNREHCALLDRQPFAGRIVTNSNCCVSGIALALAPLLGLGIRHVHVVTLQSASGAGYPGVPAMDLLGNTIPHIAGEEEKICWETLKILGTPYEPACFAVSATVHRVPVLYGHTLTLHITFSSELAIADVVDCYRKKNSVYPGTFMLHDSVWHPQVRMDLSHDDMRVHIGLISHGGENNTIKMNVLVHNLVRGAAGAVIANMHAVRLQLA